MPRGATTHLFHAIVGLGLASGTATCGGIAAAPRDASADVTTSDAVVGFDTGLGSSMPDDATAANDASTLLGPDADDSPADAGADDVYHFYPPDGWIPPVQ